MSVNNFIMCHFLDTELKQKKQHSLPSLLECDNAIVHEKYCITGAAEETIKCHNSVTFSSPKTPKQLMEM